MSVAKEPLLPEIRAFRALRFNQSKVGDLSRVICPPYDVIGPQLHQALLARHPANAVRLDLPESQGGEADERYRVAARTLSAWRMDGTLFKDGQPSIYAYEQTYRVPGGDKTRTQRGFFGRLYLEDLVPGSGVLPHEKTLSAPKEDRYKLLRATGVNTSPVVGLFADPSGASARALAEIDSAQRTITLVRPSDTLLGRQFRVDGLTPEGIEHYREHFAEEHLPREQLMFDAVDALALEDEDFVESIRAGRSIQRDLDRPLLLTLRVVPDLSSQGMRQELVPVTDAQDRGTAANGIQQPPRGPLAPFPAFRDHGMRAGDDNACLA